MALYYPLETIESSFVEKGSEFISYLVSINHFDEFVMQKRLEHPKAVHFVTSHRRLNECTQIEEGFSDDGEPRGTSGMPTLKVLRGYELIECGLLVVRYFGGTLLGAGGLVRAYTRAARDVAVIAREQGLLQEYVQRDSVSVQVAFSDISKVEYWTKKMGVSVVRREFLDNGVEVWLEANNDELRFLLNKIESQ